MNKKQKIVATVVFVIVIFLIVLPSLFPLFHKESFWIEGESKIRVSVKIKSYSNDIRVVNNATINVKLLRRGENTANITLTNVFLSTLFEPENITREDLLSEEGSKVNFQMGFKYSLTWKKIDLKVKADFNIKLHNGTIINDSSGYIGFITLRPVPNYRGIITYTIAGVISIIFIPTLCKSIDDRFKICKP